MSTTQKDTDQGFRDLLGRLRVHGGRGSPNPHKLVLLLAVATLLRQDKDHVNRFTFEELEPVFADQFERYAPHWPADRRLLEYPFYHLQSDGCWHLHLKQGCEDRFRQYEETRLTRRRLLETVDYACLEPSIFSSLSRDDSVSLLRERALALAPDAGASEVGHSRRLADEQASYTSLGERASLFAHEARAIQAIDEKLGSTGILLENVWIHDEQSNGYYECDLIVATHSGIYVVELKHWSGRVRVQPNQWLIDGYRFRPDPHIANGFKCRLVKTLYEHRFPTYPNLWVESVVVLTNPDAEIENADSPSVAAQGTRHNLTFASIGAFIAYLRRREAPPERRVLADGQIRAITDHIKSQSEPPRSREFGVPGYETVEYLSQRPDCIELIARPVDGRSRGLTRFRVFRPSVSDSDEERRRAKRKAHSTVDVVEQIGDHPNIHTVWVHMSEEGDVVEGCRWSESGTLRDLMNDAETRPSVDEALEICYSIASGLAAAHRVGIIHRAVKPEHVLMMNGIPKLTDFDLSFHLERPAGDLTVLPDPTRLKDDGYTAPELLDGRDIDEGTDLFSLGVIAYELLVGEKPCATARQLASQGGVLREEHIQRLRDVGLSDEVVDAIKGTVVADRARRLRDATALADAFAPDGEAADGAAEVTPNAKLEPGETYDVYEILEFLGQGAEAQIYRARTVDEEQVALKVFNREVPRERALRERALMRRIRSEHVVRSDGRFGHWNGERYFVVMEYVEGETLRQRIDRGDLSDEESFRCVALGLLDGLRSFHEQCDDEGRPSPLVHGDVKPDNVVITHDGSAKLLDLSVAGSRRIDEFAGTVGYVPPDRILGPEMQFAPDGDVFALGVTLWEWVFGAKPYQTPAVGDTPSTPAQSGSCIPTPWIEWLLRALATDGSQRYASAGQMQAAIPLEFGGEPTSDAPTHAAAISVDVEPAPIPLVVAPSPPEMPIEREDNPFVDYLNTLSSASAGNENATAEAQSGNPLFERVYVPNPLVEFISTKLIRERRNVILTGNAGDGKTTIAAEIYHRLTGQWMPPLPRVTVSVDGKQLVIVKDMSELTAADRADVLEQPGGDSNSVYLVVSNTGTLLESARGLTLEGLDAAHVESDLLTALEADDIVPVLRGHFLLLNIGRTDSIETACSVLRRMLAPENWEVCGACALSGDCPLYANVRLVHENAQPMVERVALVYRRLYEYGVRLTMRQMVGHLAYALTADRSCAELRQQSSTALQNAWMGSLFFNRFFGDDGRDSERLLPKAMQLYPVVKISEADFGVILDPYIERGLWGDGAHFSMAESARSILRRLRGQTERPSHAARRQARRLLYFFGALDDEAGRAYLTSFLRSPMLLEYLEFTREGGGIPALKEQRYRGRALQVLQEHFAAVRLPEGEWEPTHRLYITLSRRRQGSRTQVVMTSLAGEDFRLVVAPGHRSVKGCRGRLALEWRGGEAKLPLELPFLDYVVRRSEGEVAAQLSAFYVDRLERLKARLLSTSGNTDRDCLQLVRIGADRRLLPVRVLFVGDHLEVLR